MHIRGIVSALILIMLLSASPEAFAQKEGKKAGKAGKEATEDKKAEKTANEEKDATKAHPLVAEIEVAMQSGFLIEPAGKCAWDLFKILKESIPSEPSIKPLSEKLFAQLGAAGSDSLNLYLQGTNRVFTREDWLKAQAYIERARQLKQDNKELKVIEFFYKGMIALSERQPDKAEELFRQGIKLDSKAAYFYNGLGRALSDQKKDDESLKAYQKANLLAPQWTYPLVNSAIKLQKRGELEFARQAVERALEINSGDLEARSILASVYASLGNDDDAIREYKTSVLQRPNSAADHIALGRLLLEKGEYVEAEQAFSIAMRINPLDPRTRLYLSIATSRRAREIFNSSLSQVRETAKQSPEDTQLQLLLATAAGEQSRHSDEIDAIRSILKAEPWHLNLRLRLAKLLIEIDRTNESLEEYYSILKTSPNSKEAHNGLGNALKKTGQIKEAILEYRKAITLDETYVPARYNLAAALQEKGEIEAAANEYRTILAAEPTHTAAANALKEIESKLGQTNQ
jgi:tetratricopeptide (TPR) repeat protein